MTLVIGIDPSLTATGLVDHHGDAHTCTYPADVTGDQRLAYLWEWIAERVPLAPAEPVAAVIEDLPTHAQGAGKTGMASGVVRLLLRSYRITYAVATPATLKKVATGSGNATKPDMRLELYKRTGIDLRDDNQVDAWWLRQIGLQRWSNEHLDLPQTHTVGLAKVAWPSDDELVVA